MTNGPADPSRAHLDEDVLGVTGIAAARPSRGFTSMQAFQIFLVLLVIVVVFSALAPGSFLSWSNFRGIAVNTAILAILGVGTTFIITTAGIDLSMGSVLIFSGVMASITTERMGDHGWSTAIVVILVAIASGTFWGMVNGFVVAKMKVPAMIATLGTFIAVLGFAQVLTDGIDRRAVPSVLVESVGFGRVFGIPILVLVAAVIVTIGAIMFARTKFGLYTRAVGSNAEACRRVGINVDRHLIKVYAFAGMLAGIAGIVNLSFFRSTMIAGHSLTNMDVIAGVVIGGTSLFGGIGSVIGTVVGLFIPTTLRNGFIILGIEPYWQQVAVGFFMIAAVYLDQTRRAAAARGLRQRSLLSRLAGRGKED
ncbi:MAG TPA: ABC transporter permease [Actinomycetaceae bacterium]|nr:ABC transporter permease [Actinomycetaceae bacterium]